MDVEEFIRENGNQSYHRAVELVVGATVAGNTQDAEMFAAMAAELLQRGYHKFPRNGIEVKHRKVPKGAGDENSLSGMAG